MILARRRSSPELLRLASSPASARAPLPRLGDYEILDRIGGGGMAEVFLARRLGSTEQVAIKRILPQRSCEPDFIEMLLDEARIMESLSHPGIVRFHELQTHDGFPFIVMELVEGPSLLELIRRLYFRRERMQPVTAAAITMAICEALEHVHTRRSSFGRPLRIVHRDVNPANVLISRDGEVKLCDFGISKAVRRRHQTQAGGIKGKYCYMAPEQAQGGEVDARSDIFAAGLVLFELLTGENPLHAADEVETIERARLGNVPPPSRYARLVPAELEAICMRALCHAPEHRYPRAAEMARELALYLEERPLRRASFASWVRRVCPGARRPRPCTSEGPTHLLPTLVP